MHIISCVSGKGGTGKTTLCSALAVKAATISARVALVDLDPQRSLIEWWSRRGRPENPTIFEGADTASDAVDALAQTGWDWVFIDTPPAFVHVMRDAVKASDLVIVPLRPSALDLVASETAVIMAREEGAQMLCVLNDADPRWKTTASAHSYLFASGTPVAETIIAHRAAYLAAVTSGRSGPEVERDGKARREIDALWAEITAKLGAPR